MPRNSTHPPVAGSRSRMGHGGTPGEQMEMRPRGTSEPTSRLRPRCAPRRRPRGRRGGRGSARARDSRAGSRRVVRSGWSRKSRSWTVTSRAASREGIRSGWADCATSTRARNRSTGGQSSRCQSQFSSRTGIRRSTTEAPGTTSGRRRSFQDAEKRTRDSPPAPSPQAPWPPDGRIRRRRFAREARVGSRRESAQRKLADAISVFRRAGASPYLSID